MDISDSERKANGTEQTFEFEKLKIFLQLQQNEVNYHWTRNNYFLLVSSILLIAFVQVKGQTLQTVIGFVGLSLNVIWLLIQVRSNRYIHYWNQQIYAFGNKAGLPPIYSAKDRAKIPIRILGLLLPVPFIALWILVVIVSTVLLRC